MTSNAMLAFCAALFSAALALAAILRRRRSPASWSFFAGMLALAADSACAGMSLRVTEPAFVAQWQTIAFTAKAFLPSAWLCFSLTYSRGNYREFIAKWQFALAISFLLPLEIGRAHV